ncbi:hypothetical protein EYF80_049490 [Liparis tanakae]|uniref:Uncharacterized protein n=1 Tax=Liparis tanakae TaxID=230148 RepID=A0A4Z2FHW8_9TELE|nr:hypothetical protein EYF80_049490 [Liparis tanakae]
MATSALRAWRQQQGQTGGGGHSMCSGRKLIGRAGLRVAPQQRGTLPASLSAAPPPEAAEGHEKSLRLQSKAPPVGAQSAPRHRSVATGVPQVCAPEDRELHTVACAGQASSPQTRGDLRVTSCLARPSRRATRTTPPARGH